jgi:hypothetical protein
MVSFVMDQHRILNLTRISYSVSLNPGINQALLSALNAGSHLYTLSGPSSLLNCESWL